MPSKILALVCLTIVRRFRPTWLAVTVAEAAREVDVNHERVSRLATAGARGFAVVLAPLLRRGRPPKDRNADEQAQRLAVTQALLGIASGLLAHVSWRKPAVHALVVGAYLRLAQEHPRLTQKAFCEALSLSPRTLRHWLAHPGPDALASTSPVEPESPVPSPRKRPPRRPRFGFQVVLPATQLAGDTTSLSAFDCPLKLIASQDIGGRDEDLLESVIIDDHESADIVTRTFAKAVDDREGFQVIVDQGTPYMAEATREALDAIGAEHAPQVEGTPTDKATIERAFESVKSIAAPLLALSDRLAHKVPALRNTRLAIALSTLLVTALLKSYQAGARAQRRAAQQRQGLRREDLLEVASEHRQRSRAEDRSRLLLLRRIHDAYDIQRPLMRFVRSLRHFPIEVLKRAELAFGTQVHRDDIRDRASYFFAIVRRLHQDFIAEQARNKRQLQQREHQLALQRDRTARQTTWTSSPATWLTEALQALAAQWRPESRDLLFGGKGIGRCWMADAIALLTDHHGQLAARDIADGVFLRFASAFADRLGDHGLTAIRSLLDQHLPQPQVEAPSRCVQGFVVAILPRVGSPQRSAPDGALSNLPARPGGS